ncbi:MAG: peptidase S15 [Idiomarina sp. T82-3]|uniref:alpha/beta hydrolase family protein n=1 Tax=Idiomarina TaxID=135575 RepID=UPI00079CB05D|nr:prolyl oligopeptidase family serine peptidase [Idiomarina sp. T82-3]KXS36224.1 MAG: peptidase S15 [Idiomarina sp. T82-3]
MKHKTAIIAVAFILTVVNGKLLADEPGNFLREKNCFDDSYEAFITSLTVNAPDRKKSAVADMYRSKIRQAEFDELQADFMCKVIVYQSGQYPVGGLLLTPKIKKNERLKTIIYNRGGNARFGALSYVDIFQQLKPITDLGVAVFATQYRGGMELTDGPGEHVDEFGGRDVQDVVNIVKLAAKLPYIDQNDMHMIGVSRGGMSSFLSLLKVKNIKTLTVIGSPSDLFKAIQERPEMEAVFKARVPDYSANKEVELKKRSVVYWAEDLPRDVPVLILHGEKDKRVSVEQAKVLAGKLSGIGHPHKLVTYNDFHGLPFSQGLMLREIEAWIKRDKR